MAKTIQTSPSGSMRDTRMVSLQHGGNAREGLFAAMPPLEALKLVISLTVSKGRHVHVKNAHKMMFIDISKAYLHADVINNELYVELPAEMNLPNNCGHLKKDLNGTRDAAKCWENDSSTTMATLGYVKGKGSPCLFKHAASGSMAFIHGDDFVVSGAEMHLKDLKKAICDKYKAKVRAILDPEIADDKSVVMLGRILEWKEHGVDVEADPKHVELILKEMGMEECKGSDVVGRTRLDDDEEGKLLPQDARRFRSIAARCNFIAADRIDIQLCKEVCRRMSASCESDWKMLKSVARHVKSYPRLLVQYPYQEPPLSMDAIVDTNFAGCRGIRKSTNGGYVTHGTHLIKSWATTQTVIAMSSGEAEYYGVVKGACEAVGVVSLLQDLTGRRSNVRVSTDSSAARGIAMRRGVRKVRHLEVRTLWPQDEVDRGLIQVAKIAGQTNPADVCTKYLDGRRLQEMLSLLPLCFTGGRHVLAPQLHGEIHVLMPADCTEERRPRGV